MIHKPNCFSHRHFQPIHPATIHRRPLLIQTCWQPAYFDMD